MRTTHLRYKTGSFSSTLPDMIEPRFTRHLQSDAPASTKMRGNCCGSEHCAIRFPAAIRFDQLPLIAAHQFRTTVMGASPIPDDTADEIRNRWPSGATS